MNELIENVEQWSRDRDLHNAEPSKQFLKLIEELGETAEGLAKNDINLYMDGVGDLLVTIIILCQQTGVSMEDCLAMAFEEISDRKGKTINGVFVKEADLKEQPE